MNQLDFSNSIFLSALAPAEGLEAFLSGSWLRLSRAQIKRAIPSRTMRGRPVAARSEWQLPLDLINHMLVNPVYTGPAIEVIAQDAHFLVVNKPAGIHGHPLHYHEQQTVLNFLRSQLPILGKPSLAAERQLLNRLDNGTSGVLIWVKDPELHLHLREHFATVVKRKCYRAIVHGQIAPQFNWEDELESSTSSGARVRVAVGTRRDHKLELGRACLSGRRLSYSPEQNLSLVEIELRTGLRHQIRVQLAHHGHPIWGDPFYGGQEAVRLFLHAYQYELSWEVGGVSEQRTFTATHAPCFSEFWAEDGATLPSP